MKIVVAVTVPRKLCPARSLFSGMTWGIALTSSPRSVMTN